MGEREIKMYRLMVEDSATNLEDIVNSFIKKGWQPFGPPQVLLTNDYTEEYEYQETYCQALVKY